MVDRTQMLRSMIDARPSDPFPRYGLAMEYRRLEQFSAAVDEFEQLIKLHPDYVPTYLMAGQVLVALAEPQRAAQVLRAGIEVAARLGESKALGELRDALMALGNTP